MGVKVNSNWESKWVSAEIKMRCWGGRLEMLIKTAIGEAPLPICYFDPLLGTRPHPIGDQFGELIIEGGVTPLDSHGGTSWSADIAASEKRRAGSSARSAQEQGPPTSSPNDT